MKLLNAQTISIKRDKSHWQRLREEREAERKKNQPPLHIRSFLMKGSSFRLPVKDQIERLLVNLEKVKLEKLHR